MKGRNVAMDHLKGYGLDAALMSFPRRLSCREAAIQAYRAKKASRLAKLGHNTSHLVVGNATTASLRKLMQRQEHSSGDKVG